MMMGKGTSKFSTLTARDLVTVQISHLRVRFELAEKSVLAEKAVQLVNASFERYEQSQGTIRVQPGQMVAEHQGEKMILPLLETSWIKRLGQDMALDGMTTKEIAERIYHTPVAVDAYLKTFDRLLILRYYRMPMSAITRAVGYGRRLIEEHLALAEKHFPKDMGLHWKRYVRGNSGYLQIPPRDGHPCHWLCVSHYQGTLRSFTD